MHDDYDRLARLEATFEQAAVGIAHVRPDGSFIDVNEQFCSITGHDKRSLLENGFQQITHPADLAEDVAKVESLLSGKASRYAMEKRYIRADREIVWVNLTVSLVRDDFGEPNFFVAVIEDVSTRKAAEAMRDKATAQARAKSTFLANMSHEIRTPMTGVLGFAELLADTELNQEQLAYVQAITQSGNSMMNILNDILDFSKIEAGKLKISEANFELRGCLENWVRLFRPAADAKGISLSLYVTSSVPKLVKGDQFRIGQIICNLIGNAVKFTDQGSIHVSVDEEAASGMLSFSIEDTGIGIESTQSARIFNQFEQGGTGTSQGGTGLGLSISTQLANLMGGSLTVISEPGRGSKFTLQIPLKIEREPGDKAAELGPYQSKADNWSPRILLAEDFELNQRLFLSMLSNLGLEADVADDGQFAVEKVEQARASCRPYDIIFMDVQMPNMDGITATGAIRKSGPESERTVIYALTANSYPEDVQRCLNAGMQGHIAKPFKKSALQQAVREAEASINKNVLTIVPSPRPAEAS